MKQRYILRVLTQSARITIQYALLMCAVLFANSWVSAEPVIYLYTYHNKPPFIVDLDAKTGLYYDLAAHLSERDPDNNYRTAYVPRRRLDRMIETETLDGVIVGVSPVWFDDREEKTFLWFPSIYDDSDEFVSLKTSPLNYSGLASLTGKRFATVAGYYYFGVTEAAARGDIDPIETIGERQVLELVALGRADFGIVSRSVLTYLTAHEALSDVFHLSEQPHDVFERRAFTLLQHKHIHNVLAPLLTELENDIEWQEQLKRYQ